MTPQIEKFIQVADSGDWRHFIEGNREFRLQTEDGAPGRRFEIRNQNDSLEAVGRIVHLDWDTEFFGFPCAKLEGLFFSKEDADPVSLKRRVINRILDEEELRDIRFLSCRIRADDLTLAHALESSGFNLMDILSIYTLNLSGRKIPDQKPRDHKPGMDEILSLLKRGVDGMSSGRLFSDPNIPLSQAREFYYRVSKHYLGISPCISILEDHGTTQGVAIGILDEEISRLLGTRYGYLWLIALAPELKGKGLGRELFEIFCDEFSGHCDVLEIGTQIDNYPANRVYNSCGCRLESHLLTFHRWAST